MSLLNLTLSKITPATLEHSRLFAKGDRRNVVVFTIFSKGIILAKRLINLSYDTPRVDLIILPRHTCTYQTTTHNRLLESTIHMKMEDTFKQSQTFWNTFRVPYRDVSFVDVVNVLLIIIREDMIYIYLKCVSILCNKPIFTMRMHSTC
jgi:hypothetical protein